MPPKTRGTRSWQEHQQSIADWLQRRTGADVAAWKARIRRQHFADEAGLRSWLTILDVIVAHLPRLGQVTLQPRKGYVSLLTPRRTFATVQPTTKRRVDLGLRLAKPGPTGRLGRRAWATARSQPASRSARLRRLMTRSSPGFAGPTTRTADSSDG